MNLISQSLVLVGDGGGRIESSLRRRPLLVMICWSQLKRRWSKICGMDGLHGTETSANRHDCRAGVFKRHS